MALITCPDCGSQISDKATQCPKCGCPVENALQNAEKEQESEKKQHVSEIVEEQERIISHLEKSAEEETKSVVEKQKEIISKLEEEKANDFKSKRFNLGKYLFYGILFCILLIGGYFLLNSNEKKEFDSNAGLIEDPIYDTNAIANTNREIDLELKALSNSQFFNKALATTGVILDFNYKNDSIRLFFIATEGVDTEYDYYHYDNAKFMAYYFKVNNPQDFYSCKFVEVESPEGERYADFNIFDTNNNFIGDLGICIDLYENESEPYTSNVGKNKSFYVNGPEVIISKQRDDIEWIRSNRVLSKK